MTQLQVNDQLVYAGPAVTCWFLDRPGSDVDLLYTGMLVTIMKVEKAAWPTIKIRTDRGAYRWVRAYDLVPPDEYRLQEALRGL